PALPAGSQKGPATPEARLPGGALPRRGPSACDRGRTPYYRGCARLATQNGVKSPMTVATEALDDFVSVTLLQVKPKSGQLTVENLLKADVKRLLQSALPEMVPKQVLEASIERL